MPTAEPYLLYGLLLKVPAYTVPLLPTLAEAPVPVATTSMPVALK